LALSVALGSGLCTDIQRVNEVHRLKNPANSDTASLLVLTASAAVEDKNIQQQVFIDGHPLNY
jgi:hypothetical protein